MNVQIDNKKMWESLIKECKRVGGSTMEELVKCIRLALSDQNFKYENGKIVRIKPEPRWYKCVNPFPGFTKGKLYQTNENENLLSDDGNTIWIKTNYLDCFFRPATEEEVTEHFNKLMSKDSEEFKTDGLIPSGTKEFQEAPDGLTEFEKALYTMLNDGLPEEDRVSVDRVKGSAEFLLSVVEKEIRKKIVSEIINSADTMAQNYYQYYNENDVCEDVAKEHKDSFFMGIEHALNIIRKGE